MALKSSSPLNLAALRQDYSMLPRIAAIKAQANQGMLNAIQSGLEKRKDNIEKAEKKELNIKLLNQIIESDKKNQFVPAGVSAEELSKYVPVEETLKYAQAMGIANQELRKERQLRKAAQGLASVIPGMDEKTKRQLSRVNPGLLIELGLKARQGEDPNNELKQIGDKLYLVSKITGKATPVTERVTTPRPSEGVDSEGTGKEIPPASTAGDSPLIVPPSTADIKAKREFQTEDVLNLYRSQSRNGPVDISGIAKILKLNESVVRGILEENLDKIRGESFSKLQEMEKSLPGITEYVGRLAQIDPTKGQGQASGFLGMGREYEAGFGDVEANPKFNVFLRANPEILRIYGVPENTIADIVRLGSELPKELDSGTKLSVQELNSAARPFE